MYGLYSPGAMPAGAFTSTDTLVGSQLLTVSGGIELTEEDCATNLTVPGAVPKTGPQLELKVTTVPTGPEPGDIVTGSKVSYAPGGGV
jgi:hypothetical protein